MRKRTIIIILLAIISFGFGYGIYEYNRKPKGLKRVAPAFSITSDSLYEQFFANESLANEKYVGKVIEVSGKIEEITQKGEVTTIVLYAPEYPIGGVSCTMAEPTHSVSVGDIVQIKGECQGMLMQVILNKSILMR